MIQRFAQLNLEKFIVKVFQRTAVETNLFPARGLKLGVTTLTAHKNGMSKPTYSPQGD